MWIIVDWPRLRIAFVSSSENMDNILYPNVKPRSSCGPKSSTQENDDEPFEDRMERLVVELHQRQVEGSGLMP